MWPASYCILAACCTARNACYRVLIVEDEMFVGLDPAEELEARRYCVYGPISNVRSAEKVINTFAFQLAILDRLRDENSRRLAKSLSDLDVPVIFVTAVPDLVAKAVPDCCATVFDKPVSSARLMEAVEQLLDPSAAAA